MDFRRSKVFLYHTHEYIFPSCVDMAVLGSNLEHHEVHVTNQYPFLFKIGFLPYIIEMVFEWLEQGMIMAQMSP